MHRLAAEIAASRADGSIPQLVIGHGSGSFGHTAGSHYHTRQGVRTTEDWLGFAEVWKAARALNQIVVDEFTAAGLPVIAFPPSACAEVQSRRIASWNLAPLQAAMQVGMVPLVNGDVVFDSLLGGTILSTEEVFSYLAPHLHPQRILLAGSEPGVWADYPACHNLIAEITPLKLADIQQSLLGSSAIDTTGGMLQKVATMLDLVQQNPGLEVLIFSGREPGLLNRILNGELHGTRIVRHSQIRED